MYYTFFVYVVVNFFFAVIDITGKPEFLLKYKIQEEKAVPVRELACVFVSRTLRYLPLCTDTLVVHVGITL